MMYVYKFGDAWYVLFFYFIWSLFIIAERQPNQLAWVEYNKLRLKQRCILPLFFVFCFFWGGGGEEVFILRYHCHNLSIKSLLVEGCKVEMKMAGR